MTINHLKIGFIGFGNMAQTIASGGNQKTLFANTDSIGIHAVDTNKNLIEQVDIVVLAVKPYQIDQVITPLKEELRDKSFFQLRLIIYLKILVRFSCQIHNI